MASAGSTASPARRRPPPGYGAVGPADATDDGAEDIGQLRADQQESFGIGLGRGDPQQRHQFTGGGQATIGDAVVGQFRQFLAANAG
jgi:hypothetical protein